MKVRVLGTCGAAGLVLVAGWWWFEASVLDVRDVPVLLTGVMLALVVPSVVGQIRRPSDPLPVAAAVVAVAVVAGYFRMLTEPWVATIGAVVWLASPLVLLWAAGYARLGVVRAPVRAALGLPSILAVATAVASGPRTAGDPQDSVRATTWVGSEMQGEGNELVRQPNPSGWLADETVPFVLWALWFAWVSGVVVWAWFRSGTSTRARLAIGTVAVAVGATALAAWPERLTDGRSSLLHGRWYHDGVVLVPAVAALAAGFLAVWSELVRPRLRHASIRRMQVDGAWTAAEIRAHLSHALGDPTVRLLLADPERPAAWLDEDGGVHDLSSEADRQATVIERSGMSIAAIEYDTSLVDQPHLIDLAAASAGFALESLRSAAVAAREATEAREAATQLLVASEAARDELRDLVLDGPDRELAEVRSLLDEHPLPLEAIHDGLRRATAAVRSVSGALEAEAERVGVR